MSDLVTCPHCSKSVSVLRPLGASVIKKLEDSGQSGLPSEVCDSCYQQLAGAFAQGAILVAEAKAREQKKLMMWKSRVSLIKKARLLMREKAFADAAVSYEKYLRVLETVYDCKANELNPEHLKSTARTQELTVIASVYWDLLRIYDTSEKYASRMEVAAKKLAEFLPMTPIFPDIVKKAESFSKQAKKPQIIKFFLKKVTDKKGRCFIATSAFNSPLSPEVLWLSNWRDQYLLQTPEGQKWVNMYYLYSPKIAFILDGNVWLKPLVRKLIQAIIFILKANYRPNKTSLSSDESQNKSIDSETHLSNLKS